MNRCEIEYFITSTSASGFFHTMQKRKRNFTVMSTVNVSSNVATVTLIGTQGITVLLENLGKSRNSVIFDRNPGKMV